MALKKFLILVAFIFLGFFGVLNNQTNNYQINSIATVSASKTHENDIISQKNNVFSISNITSRNTHLKNHQNNTDGTIGISNSNNVFAYDLCLKNIVKHINNKSLAQNFLLIQKLSNAPPEVA